VARISGETAPLIFTAGGNQFFTANLNDQMPSLPMVIYNYSQSPYKDLQSLAWAGALLITLAVLALSISARIIGSQRMAK
jgi:phosphate transport system permease protein